MSRRTLKHSPAKKKTKCQFTLSQHSRSTICTTNQSYQYIVHNSNTESGPNPAILPENHKKNL